MKVDESSNYDEYNRNNNMINKIRFNNRYNNIDNSYDTLRMNNNMQQNINPNDSYQNQIILQNQNNNNNAQNMNEYNMNNLNDRIDENMNDTLNYNKFNFSNGNFNYNNNNNNRVKNNNINNNLLEERSVNLNLSNQKENNLYKNQDINIGLNEWVRNDLESRGLHVGRNISPRSIRLSQIDKKKTLLENIQAQINLKKKTKLEELNKRKQEDAKYLQDMVIFYPFGRGGGGAPNRDKSGNVITYRRALISDPKYNFASINVDDDYDEVWNREKRIGRFYRNSPESFNQNNLNNDIQMNDNNNNIPNNNYNPQQVLNNNKGYQLSRSMILDNNPEYNNNFNNQFRMSRRTPNINQNRNDINIYNELLSKLREQNEILRRQLEEERENERLRKEKEKEEEEEQKKLEKMKEEEMKEKEENELMMEENNKIYRNKIFEKEIIDPDSIILDKNAVERINRSEIESRNKLNNEIYRLRSQMQDQQMLLFQQISNLKVEAEKANSQREEALREIERLKLQIYQDNKEDRQKRYIHHVIVTDDDKNVEKSIQTEQPKNNEDTLELNKLLKKNIDRLNYLEEIERLNAIRRSPPSNYELEYPKKNVIPEKEEEDDDLYEIEISKVHN